jgi:hypothetical protein
MFLWSAKFGITVCFSQHLEQLPDCIFSGMMHLEHLILHNTRLQHLHPNSLCCMDSLVLLDAINNSIEFISGNPFDNVPQLTTVITDSNTLCCSLPLHVQCVFNGIIPNYSCSQVMPYFAIEIFRGISGMCILLLNMTSAIFWLSQQANNRWLAFIVSLNTSDLIMGLYAIILVGTDIHYSSKYTAFSSIHWQTSWLCGLAMMLGHFSFEASLYLLMVHSCHRLVITKYVSR